MRLVIDTNVLLSALLWRNTPYALLEQARNGVVTLISSPALLAELAEVLERPKFDAILAKSDTSRAQLFAKVRLLVEVPDEAQAIGTSSAVEFENLVRLACAWLISAKVRALPRPAPDYPEDQRTDW